MLYSCILRPELIPLIPVSEPTDVKTEFKDYFLTKILYIPEGFREVYLRTIRFNISHYNKDNQSAFAITIPYQVHIASSTLSSNQCEFRVLQNTMHLSQSGLQWFISNANQPSLRSVGVYSTLCIESNYSRVTRSNVLNEDGQLESTYTERRYFEMVRNVCLGKSNTLLQEYRFEVFFTDLNGQRYNTLIPNVEIELDFV